MYSRVRCKRLAPGPPGPRLTGPRGPARCQWGRGAVIQYAVPSGGHLSPGRGKAGRPVVDVRMGPRGPRLPGEQRASSHRHVLAGACTPPPCRACRCPMHRPNINSHLVPLRCRATRLWTHASNGRRYYMLPRFDACDCISARVPPAHRRPHGSSYGFEEFLVHQLALPGLHSHVVPPK